MSVPYVLFNFEVLKTINMNYAKSYVRTAYMFNTSWGFVIELVLHVTTEFNV